MVEFKDFSRPECFKSIFQGKFNFQGLFKTVLYIQVLVNSVRTLYSNEKEPVMNYFCLLFEWPLKTGFTKQSNI